MISKWDKKIEIVENTFKKYSKRRIKNIYDSLYRPLYQEILKCLYITAMLIIDSFLLLEIIIIFEIPFNIIIFLVFFFIIIYIELRIYDKIWGINGKWSIDKYKNKRKK